MKYRSTKSLIILLITSLLVLLAIFFYGYRKIIAINEEASSLSTEVKEREEDETLAQSIKVSQGNAKDNLLKLDNLILSESKVVELIEKVEDVGKDLGLETSIKSVSSEKSKDPGMPNKIRLTIESTGSWSGVISFIEAIENLPHRVFIENVNLNKSDTLWQLQVNISIYSFDK